eukprot:GHVR01089858.1.p1 GENE.GHVR01089858.1~~GHVR01089858.1.p1  ORF type:complete len:186 (+),score=39.48 GHVR01089858.1:37-594(+)
MGGTVSNSQRNSEIEGLFLGSPGLREASDKYYDQVIALLDSDEAYYPSLEPFLNDITKQNIYAVQHKDELGHLYINEIENEMKAYGVDINNTLTRIQFHTLILLWFYKFDQDEEAMGVSRDRGDAWSRELYETNDDNNRQERVVEQFMHEHALLSQVENAKTMQWIEERDGDLPKHKHSKKKGCC